MTRVITAVCIVVFFAAVQPSEVPPMWIIAALSIGSYEIIAMAARADRLAQKRRRRRRQKTKGRGAA